jgi:hypothetical protein
MNKKLTGKALTEFEAERDVWQEVWTASRKSRLAGASGGR